MCTCEHNDHFESDRPDRWGRYHLYGAGRRGDPVRAVRTDYGTFHLCSACDRAGHLSGYEIDDLGPGPLTEYMEEEMRAIDEYRQRRVR